MNTMTMNFPKMKFVLPELADLQTVADKAQSLLRYSGLQANVQEMKLLSTLAQLDIMPFASEAVSVYKTTERNKTRLFGFLWASCDWYSTPLDEFSGVVPASALKLALTIKEASCRNAVTGLRFNVDYLSKEEWRHRVEDPFLSVQIGLGRPYYVAVWNEPNFQA